MKHPYRIINQRLPRKNTVLFLALVGLFALVCTARAQSHSGSLFDLNPDAAYRAEITQSIIDQWQGTSDVTRTPRWEKGIRHWLNKLSTEDLESALDADSYSEFTGILRRQGIPSSASDADRALAATGKLFYTVAPCRIVDTRLGSGIYTGPVIGPIEQDYHAKNATQIEAQGGKPGGCGVPATATALVVNLTVTQPIGGGLLTAFPYATPRPLASILNFSRDTLANSTILPVCSGNCAADFTVFASTTTHIIVDVMGYFAD